MFGITLTKYILDTNDTVLKALQVIDTNKKGFVLVTDSNRFLKGTLTDGDIRRAFIVGADVSTPIEKVYNKNYTSLKISAGVTSAIDLFKNNSIKFLPIIDDNQKLLNVITKEQLHALLLQDIHADLTYDFSSLDESIIDYEIFQRPWGFYKTTVYNEYFQSKVISVNPRSKLSLQVHHQREEHWVIAHGTGTVQVGDSFIEAKCGNEFFIPKGCKHRLINTSNSESLIVTEVQIGSYLGEDDIIRYEDDYGRT